MGELSWAGARIGRSVRSVAGGGGSRTNGPACAAPPGMLLTWGASRMLNPGAQAVCSPRGTRCPRSKMAQLVQLAMRLNRVALVPEPVCKEASWISPAGTIHTKPVPVDPFTGAAHTRTFFHLDRVSRACQRGTGLAPPGCSVAKRRRHERACRQALGWVVLPHHSSPLPVCTHALRPCR